MLDRGASRDVDFERVDRDGTSIETGRENNHQEEVTMALSFSRWERRDNADRAAFGLACLEVCRAWKESGVRARFYWTGPDSVAILGEGEDAAVFDAAPPVSVSRAVFALGDLARQTSAERWIDPRQGAEAYARAGR